MKGPIGYELSPLATEASQIVQGLAKFLPEPEDKEQISRLLQIVEVMDVEIASRGIALSSLRERVTVAVDYFDKLSKLGNEPLLGNSVGNRIAQEAKSRIELTGGLPAPKPPSPPPGANLAADGAEPQPNRSQDREGQDCPKD